jgi:hypothetical protein
MNTIPCYNFRLCFIQLSAMITKLQHRIPLCKILVWLQDDCVKITSKFYTRTGDESSEGEERHSSTLINLGTRLSEWLTPCPGRFTPRNNLVPIV